MKKCSLFKKGVIFLVFFFFEGAEFVGTDRTPQIIAIIVNLKMFPFFKITFSVLIKNNYFSI